jgi:hypothetical protein
MPFQSTCPEPGQRVGGVSGRPTREREEEQSSPRHSRRNGGRHPGSRDAGSLRGMSEKRGPRPVRTSLIRGLFLLGRAHRRQRVSSGSRRRGTSSACARRTRSARESSNSRSEDTSFARSRDPCSSIVTEARLLALDASRGRQAGCGAVDSVSRAGKLAQAGRTGTGIERSDAARLAARHRSSGSPQGQL